MGLFGKERDLNRPPEEVLLEVDGSFFQTRKDELEVRLDHFLGAHLTWRSRSSIQRLIKDRFVYLDPAAPEAPHGRGEWKLETRPGRRLLHGTRVKVVIPPDLRLPAPEGPASPVSVLMEDDDLLAIDKPPMVPVHPSGRFNRHSLTSLLGQSFPEERFFPVHRLDADTTGVLVLAKDRAAARALASQFESRSVNKTYLARVRGIPEADVFSCETAIAATPGPEGRRVARSDGQPAHTAFQVVSRARDTAVILVRPISGRTNQIRAHLAELGHPIVGDGAYGSGGSMKSGVSRLCLHAWQLELNHPRCGRGCRFVSAAPSWAGDEARLEGFMASR